MKISDMKAPSKYIATSDLLVEGTTDQYVEVEFVIGPCKEEEMQDYNTKKMVNKNVLYFQGEDKGLVLNQTNINTLSNLYGGRDTDEWIGHKIILFAQLTQDRQGKPCMGLRVRGIPAPAKSRVGLGNKAPTTAREQAKVIQQDDDGPPLEDTTDYGHGKAAGGDSIPF